MPPVLLVLIAAEANALLLPRVGVKAAVGVPEPVANNAPFVDGSLASLARRMQRLDERERVAARCPLAIHATCSLFGVDAKDTLDGAQHALIGRVVRDKRRQERLEGEVGVSASRAAVIISATMRIELVLLAVR